MSAGVRKRRARTQMKPQTPNPKPQTPNPKPQTPNPKPKTLGRRAQGATELRLPEWAGGPAGAHALSQPTRPPSHRASGRMQRQVHSSYKTLNLLPIAKKVSLAKRHHWTARTNAPPKMSFMNRFPEPLPASSPPCGARGVPSAARSPLPEPKTSLSGARGLPSSEGSLSALGPKSRAYAGDTWAELSISGSSVVLRIMGRTEQQCVLTVCSGSLGQTEHHGVLGAG